MGLCALSGVDGPRVTPARRSSGARRDGTNLFSTRDASNGRGKCAARDLSEPRPDGGRGDWELRERGGAERKRRRVEKGGTGEEKKSERMREGGRGTDGEREGGRGEESGNNYALPYSYLNTLYYVMRSINK